MPLSVQPCSTRTHDEHVGWHAVAAEEGQVLCHVLLGAVALHAHKDGGWEAGPQQVALAVGGVKVGGGGGLCRRGGGGKQRLVGWVGGWVGWMGTAVGGVGGERGLCCALAALP